ncbi:MAG: YqfO family protein [Candidatus Levybacteria bacterium]|nr:YqfO family protein [Candidatus Levybacteria bacterium]
MEEMVKIVVFVPLTHTDIVRRAMGDAGAGMIGNYSHCTFSSKGYGRYKPLQGANPAIGKVGKFEKVEEERIETMCPKKKAKEVIATIKKVHPYEEVALDIYPLINQSDL